MDEVIDVRAERAKHAVAIGFAAIVAAVALEHGDVKTAERLDRRRRYHEIDAARLALCDGGGVDLRGKENSVLIATDDLLSVQGLFPTSS